MASRLRLCAFCPGKRPILPPSSSIKSGPRHKLAQWRTITVQERRHLAAMAKPPSPFIDNADFKPDILIVGSGAAGMTAALRAKSRGLSPLIIEKTSRVGGSTTYSAGVMWIPNSHVPTPGYEDTPEEALKYMEALIGDPGPASSRERKLAFIENAPKMAQFLDNQGFHFIQSLNYPDYYPDLPGGKALGRSIEGALFNVNKLGPWKTKLNYSPTMPQIPIHAYEGPVLFQVLTSLRGVRMAIKILRRMIPRLWGENPLGTGVSLTGQLLYLNLQNDIPIWTDSSLEELIVKNKKVVGAVIKRQGRSVQVEAPGGLLLTSGGFSQNAEMRRTYQSYNPTTNEYSLAPLGDQGDGIRAARKVGAATALMGETWWFPCTKEPASKMLSWLHFERPLPHTIIVDKEGNRFANEAESYTDFVQNQFERHKTVPTIPAYLIMDSQHRKRYPFNFLFPGKVPQKYLDSGFVTQAATLTDLASKLGVNVNGLVKTVTRWNAMVTKGVDEDYKRGSSVYDAFHGDPKYSRNGGNPNMGTIERGPFYAVSVWPGDLGTKGGILTDEHARALKEDGKGGFEVIEGLYATGNCSASVMGRRYVGAGATISPAMTFAFIAADHMARVSRDGAE